MIDVSRHARSATVHRLVHWCLTAAALAMLGCVLAQDPNARSWVPSMLRYPLGTTGVTPWHEDVFEDEDRQLYVLHSRSRSSPDALSTAPRSGLYRGFVVVHERGERWGVLASTRLYFPSPVEIGPMDFDQSLSAVERLALARRALAALRQARTLDRDAEHLLDRFSNNPFGPLFVVRSRGYLENALLIMCFVITAAHWRWAAGGPDSRATDSLKESVPNCGGRP